MLAYRPLEWYRCGLRDDVPPRTARACLRMCGDGLASMLDGGLVKTAHLRVLRLLGGSRRADGVLWIWAEAGAAMLPAEPLLARRILAERVLAATGSFLAMSTTHKRCHFHRQGFCIVEDLTLRHLGEALDRFQQLGRGLVLSVGCVIMGVVFS